MSQINAGFDNNSPQSIEKAYGALSAGRTVPYASVAAAIAGINQAYRYRGKTVMIDDIVNPPSEYWWRMGTTDQQLVPKILHEQVLEFIIGDTQVTTPADQASAWPNIAQPNPGTLINCVILGVGGDGGGVPSLARTGYQSYQYNKASGIITLVNTVFSLNSWYWIKFRQL